MCEPDDTRPGASEPGAPPEGDAEVVDAVAEFVADLLDEPPDGPDAG